MNAQQTDTTPNLFSIPLDRVTQSKTLAIIEKRLLKELVTRIVTINPEFVLTAIKDQEFKTVLQTADLRLADGIGLIWATHVLQLPPRFPQIFKKLPKLYSAWQCLYTLASIPFSKRIYSQLPARVTGSDLFVPLLHLLAEKNQAVFLLGGAPGVAKATAEKLKGQIPDLNIVGTYAGSPAIEESGAITKMIRESKAQALFVAFQFPQQDIWIAKHLPQLPGVKVAMGVGGTFDFIAGTAHLNYQHSKAKRAPLFMRKLQLEWLWRLLTQPHRWKRIWNATAVFIGEIWRENTRRKELDDKRI